jgi:membrane associated rhomboid family serine protease
MVSASVGYQCPQCAAQGIRSTRQNRSRFGVRGPSSAHVTTLVLIALNLAVFALAFVTGHGASPWFFRLSLTPVSDCVVNNGQGGYWPGMTAAECATRAGTQWYPGVDMGAWWQILTSAFTHVDPLHIGMNMLALWFLAPGLEKAIGRARFLALYLVSALGGSVAVFWLSDPATVTLGASGAIFGLMGALVVFVLRSKGNINTVLMWLGINLVYTFSMSNVSWQGHLGGLVTGAVVAVLLAYAPRKYRDLVQWGGIAALSALLILLAVVRAWILV